MYCVSQVQLFFYFAISKTMFCGQYSETTIEYSVENIEQHPLNILWTVLSNASFMLVLLRNILLLWRVLRYVHYIMWNILRNVHSKHFENENFMCSKAFPLSNSVP